MRQAAFYFGFLVGTSSLASTGKYRCSLQKIMATAIDNGLVIAAERHFVTTADGVLHAFAAK